MNIRQRLLLAFTAAAVLSLILGAISVGTIRLLNHNLSSSSSDLRDNVKEELSSMRAHNAVSERASEILAAESTEVLDGLDPSGTLAELNRSGSSSVDPDLENGVTSLYKAKLRYVGIREALDADMADFMKRSETLADLVGKVVDEAREDTISSATQQQESISSETDESTRKTLAELSSTASSTLDDTVLVLQLRGRLLELEVAVDRYLRTPSSDSAKAISTILSDIGDYFGRIPENVAGPFEVADMNSLREKAEKILTGDKGIVKQGTPDETQLSKLDEVLSELDGKLVDLADNTVFDGSNNLSSYLQQVSGDLGKSLGTLIDTQKSANDSLGEVARLQQSTASVKETLYKLLFMVQNASLKCTDECVALLRNNGSGMLSGLADNKTVIVDTLGQLGKSDEAEQINAQLDDIIGRAGGKRGIIARTIEAADAHNQSVAANAQVQKALTESTQKSTGSFSEFTERITSSMEEKVVSGSFWMKLEMLLVVFIFAAALGLGFWIGTSVSKRLAEAVVKLFGLSQKLSESAMSMTESSDEQATMASEQAASLEESSSTVEEISSMASRNNDAVREAKEISGDVMDATEESTAKMRDMSRTMDDMNSASSQIEKIIRAIDEIAFQTNILALNAAVEAARAGEAGAGFAVVADEVRNLALKCKNAAHETEEIIARSTTLTQDGVKMCASVAGSLDTIRDRINSLDDLVKQIAQASQEQTLGLEQINQSLATTSTATQKNAALAEQGASSAQELNQEADSLIQTIDSLSRLSGLQIHEQSQTRLSIGEGERPKAVLTAASMAQASRGRKGNSLETTKSGQRFLGE